VIVFVVALAGSISAADWPQWRGPRGNGASDEKNLPVKWSATENVAWKAAIGGLGVSSPIVSGDRVFVTSQIGTGVRRPGNHPRLALGASAGTAGERALAAGNAGDSTFFVVEAFNRADGRACGSTGTEAVGPLPGVHDKHNLASPSPVTDGQMVYAWFGTGQIVALDISGKVVWQRHLGKEIAPFDINWGHSSSPTLYGDTVLLLCDQAPASYLLAVGQEDRQGAVARGSRQGADVVHDAVRRRVGDRTGADRQLEPARRCLRSAVGRVSVARRRIEPVSHPGADLPRRRALHDARLSQRSVHGRPSRRPRRRLGITRRLGGTDRRALHLLARVRRGHLYMASDVGAVSAIDAATGSESGRNGSTGFFSASPVAGDGKIYFVSETGETIVLKAGRAPQVLARNDLGERLIALAGDLERTALHSLGRPVVRDREEVENW
jgi:outer membrane protein assembly factor BamB